MKCTRCGKTIEDSRRRGTPEEPYCPTCHLIIFYQFPENKLGKIMAELETYRQGGVNEETLDKLLWGALWKHADKVVREKLSRYATGFTHFRGSENPEL